MTSSRTRRQRGYQQNKHDSPEEITHATEAQDLYENLRDDFGIEPERCVPTGDGKGFVRLTFAQLKKLMYEDEPAGTS